MVFGNVGLYVAKSENDSALDAVDSNGGGEIWQILKGLWYHC